MTDQKKEKFLKEAIRIGDEFLEKGINDGNGLYWKTLRYTSGEFSWEAIESIYSGVGGITLFLLELYQETGQEKYLKAVEDSLSWLWDYHQQNPTDYYAFFTGRLGLSYVFMLVYEELKNADYLEKSIEIALAIGEAEKQSIDDLINGASGTLLGLLVLHEKTKDGRLLEKIIAQVEQLLERAVFGINGIYWDHSNKQSRGLCGFSHGTSGIGYVFLQLGKYLGNEAFYFIAEMAFAYENQFFQEDKLNWPDFRKGFFDEDTYDEFKQKYLENDLDYFRVPGSMRAWCHGSPGIGLSRITAVKLLGEKYLTDLNQALESTHQSVQVNSMQQTFTLCHGAGGNSLLFMEAAELVSNDKLQETLVKVGENALMQRQQIGFYATGFSTYNEGGENSLFMGDAGVGYFMLRLHQKSQKPTILKPELEGSFTDYPKDSILSQSIDELKLRLIKKVFPETISGLADTKIDFDSIQPQSAYQDILDQLTKLVTAKDRITLDFERQKNELAVHPVGTSYLNIRRSLEIQKGIDYVENNTSLDNRKFYLPSENRLFTDGEEVFRLMVATGDGVLTYDELGFFAHLILGKFLEPTDLDSVITAICDEFEVEDEEEIAQTVREQVAQALKSGILYVAD